MSDDLKEFLGITFGIVLAALLLVGGLKFFLSDADNSTVATMPQVINLLEKEFGDNFVAVEFDEQEGLYTATCGYNAENPLTFIYDDENGLIDMDW